MRLYRPWFFSGWIYPEAIFRVKTTEKLLLLTFDDGPDPDSTPWIIEILKRHKLKATFFCNGREAEKYPHLMKMLRDEGHTVGNHGYDHYDGWKTSGMKYEANVDRAAEHTSGSLFRPPYGRLKVRQYNNLKMKYKIVFWDIMPYDFDESFSSADSLNVLGRKIRPGSVIVLHDKPTSSLFTFLDHFIIAAIKRNFRFALPEEIPGFCKDILETTVDRNT